MADGLEALKTPPAGTADDSDALAPYFFQVAYLARDFNRVVDFFKQVIGIEQFAELDFALGPPDDIKVKGAEVVRPFNQLIALGPVKKRRERDRNHRAVGKGKHLFGDDRRARAGNPSYLMPGADFEQYAARLRTNGIKPVIELDLPGFKGAYFDCRAAGASYIEVAEYRE